MAKLNFAKFVGKELKIYMIGQKNHDHGFEGTVKQVFDEHIILDNKHDKKKYYINTQAVESFTPV